MLAPPVWKEDICFIAVQTITDEKNNEKPLNCANTMTLTTRRNTIPMRPVISEYQNFENNKRLQGVLRSHDEPLNSSKNYVLRNFFLALTTE